MFGKKVTNQRNNDFQHLKMIIIIYDFFRLFFGINNFQFNSLIIIIFTIIKIGYFLI